MDSIYVFLAFIIAWAIAQAAKVVIEVISEKKKRKLKEILEVFVASGGMPSGHSASFSAATIMIGVLEGFDSTIFALALCVAGIIMYDAVNVRYAVGEIGKKLNKMLAKGDQVKVVEGHTLPQVIVGVMIGIVVAIIIAKITGKI